MLGDSHNFGRAVRSENSLVLKSRTVFWEWLLLGGDSPLSLYFSSLNEDLHLPFTVFPRLSFELNEYPNESKCERLKVNEIAFDEYVFTDVQLGAFGSVLALCHFFGISDLHYENTVFGIDEKDGRLIFCPIDVEVVFENNILLSQALLLESDSLTNGKSGTQSLLAGLNNNQLTKVIVSYLEYSYLLGRYRKQIINYLQNELFIGKQRVRVLIRPTADYATDRDDRKFSRCENEQLDRGDIPYYFRFLESKTIYHYTSKEGIYKPCLISDRDLEPTLNHIMDYDSLEHKFDDSVFLVSALQMIKRVIDEAPFTFELVSIFRLDITKDKILMNYRGNKIGCYL